MSSMQRSEQSRGTNPNRHRVSTALGAGALALLLTGCGKVGGKIFGTAPSSPNYETVTVGDLAGEMAKKCPIGKYVSLDNLSLGRIDPSGKDKEGTFYAAMPHGQVSPAVTVESSLSIGSTDGVDSAYFVQGQVEALDKAPPGGSACVVVAKTLGQK